MKWTTYNVEFITPCFCAGADQTKAEVRVPSIRGQLRWWFRVLGGNRTQEKAVFGGVHDKSAEASKVRLRVSNVKRGPQTELPTMKVGSPGAYIWYFASVSGEKKRWWKTPPGKEGKRDVNFGGSYPVRPRRTSGLPGEEGKGELNFDGHLPPGTTFNLHVAFRKELEAGDRDLFDRAFECFLRFGGIGMRVTRAMGAVRCKEFGGGLETFKNRADALLSGIGFHLKWFGEDPSYDNWDETVFKAEDLLKELRQQYRATRPSPLGSSSPRQTSAVYFRPIKLDNGRYVLLVYEAPYERVLGSESRTQRSVLEDLRHK